MGERTMADVQYPCFICSHFVSVASRHKMRTSHAIAETVPTWFYADSANPVSLLSHPAHGPMRSRRFTRRN
jgi:hypothetical protein